ncbi:MAG: polymer-forming cytoskeletal protein [Candidatus Thermoplasmatota archaeon]|nr:polymer-forming cytoskeletal protein [Candidatus Thermoplasmatota archaeon]
MTFDRRTLVVPDHTSFQEKMIITTGDVIISDRCIVRYGVRTDGRIFVGEHVIIDGTLEAAHDVRVDVFSAIGGNIQSGGNVFLGEKARIKGKLSLTGDLDVGDSVEIDQGFEAKGWINIRSSIPTIIYIFIYLMQLLKLGRSEEIERILEELEDSQGETIPISETFLFIPNNSIISNITSKVEGNLHVGSQCTVVGNYDVKGNVIIGKHSELIGAVRATGNVLCQHKVKIHGGITATGNINITDDVQISGNISGEEILLSKTAQVRGTLLGRKGVAFQDKQREAAREKVKRFESDVDVVDEVKGLLE